MKSLDLFSCIGCHALGFKRAGIKTVALCEIDPWRRSILQQHFRGIPIYEDVKTIEAPKANIIIGGPPCQNTSVASAVHGKRSGKSLWPHMLRVGLDMDAEWFVVEQPPSNAAWETKTASGLRRNGYHIARIEFGAYDVGAPYIRRRVFLVACTVLKRLEVAWKQVPRAIEVVKRSANARGDWEPGKLRSLRVDARSAGEMDAGPMSNLHRKKIEALGDSNPPHMAEVIGRAIMRAA